MGVLTPLLMNGLIGFGIQINTPPYSKYTAFIIEVLRALLLKQMEIEHPVQALVESLFEMQGGTLVISNIDVKMNEKESNNVSNTA